MGEGEDREKGWGLGRPPKAAFPAKDAACRSVSGAADQSPPRRFEESGALSPGDEGLREELGGLLKGGTDP